MAMTQTEDRAQTQQAETEAAAAPSPLSDPANLDPDAFKTMTLPDSYTQEVQ